MLRSDRNNIQDIVASVHSESLKRCYDAIRQTNINFSVVHLERLYSYHFIMTILESVLNEDSDADQNGFSLEEFACRLRASGFTNELESHQEDDSYLTICLNDNWFYFREDEDVRLLEWDTMEYVVAQWDQELVDLIVVIYNETHPQNIYTHIKDCLKHANQKSTQRQIIESTAKGIIRDKLRDMEYTIKDSVVSGMIYKCLIEMTWGRLEIFANLDDLPYQLDNILREKQKFDQMMVTFDDIDDIDN